MGDRILVIGAGSTLGRMLRTQWSELADVIWLSRPSWSSNLGAEALRPFMEGVDVVICLAGATPGAGVDFDLNQTIGQMVMAAAGPGRRVFLASTMAVYGGTPGPHAEDGAVAPENDYGASKLAMERSCPGAVALRLGNVVGADMLFGNLAAGRDIVLDRFADGRGPARSYLDPERLGAALLELVGLAKAGADLPAVLNLASDPPLEMAELLRAAGAAHAWRAAPQAARPLIAMDTRRVKALLPSLRQSIDETAAVAAWRRVAA